MQELTDEKISCKRWSAKEKQSGKCWTEADSNGDMITELELSEALYGVSKQTATGPDKVKYSEIKNLSEDDKNFFTRYKESITTGRFPRTGHSVT